MASTYEYDHDTGPDDDCFYEWYDVALEGGPCVRVDEESEAQKLVRVWDSHDALLVVCRHAHKVLSEICGKTDKEKLCINTLEAAIAKAEGKELPC